VVVPVGDPVVLQGVPGVLDAPFAVEAVPGAEGAVLPAVVDGLDPAVEPGIVVHGVPAVDPFVPFGVVPDVPVVAPGVVVVPGVGAGWVGVAAPGCGTVVPACGVDVPAPGVAVPAGGVAVPAGGTTAPGVEVCPAVPPAAGAPRAGAVCATIQLAQLRSKDKAKNLRPDISILHL